MPRLSSRSERLAEQDEEGARRGGPLGLGLQLCSLEGHAGLLGDAEEKPPAVFVGPATLPRSGEDRADDVSRGLVEGEREERLDAQPAAFPHERRVPGVVLLAGLDRDEPPCADRLGDGAAEVEGIHGEPGAGLLGDRGRAEGLERRVVPRAPDEDDVRVCALELRDDRLPDLGHRHGGGEARGGLFHHLRLTARGALRLVRAEQPALGRRSCPGERAEHQREDRSADEDGERRGMRHSAAARRDDEPSVGERDQPRLPAARGSSVSNSSSPLSVTRARTSAGRRASASTIASRPNHALTNPIGGSSSSPVGS